MGFLALGVPPAPAVGPRMLSGPAGHGLAVPSEGRTQTSTARAPLTMKRSSLQAEP